MIYRIVITLLLLTLSQFSLAEITVNVDRNPVVADESFQLIFESDEKVNTEPDFSALNKSFTVLNTSRRSNTKIINGNISHSQQWILTVIANKAGILGIPSIRFGKQESKPMSLNVVAKAPATKNQRTDDVFIDVDVNTRTPYVQAQVVYTVKLYRAVTTNNASLSEPTIRGGQAVINKLGEDKRYETRRNGKRYVVIERQYVIFPQSSDELKIEPLLFQGQTGTGGFFNFDPFGPQPRSIVKRSEGITLDVKPIPNSFTGDTWLPASHLTIQEQWSIDPGKLKQGEATTRTLIIKAVGLAASHLPEINSKLPEDLKQYPDQPELEETYDKNGYIGIRRDKMAIIPTEGGDYTLPAIKIFWWNTETDKMEQAELPERTIHVDTIAVADISRDDTEPAVDKGTTSIVEQGVSEDRINSELASPASTNWKWLSFGLFVLWLVTLILWWRSAYKNKTDKERTEKKLSRHDYVKQLKQACKKNEPQVAKNALLRWAKSNWPDANVASIDAIKNYSSTGFKQQLEALSKHLYGKTTDSWNGTEFIKSFESQSFSKKEKTKPVGKLEPLYKT